MELVRRAEARQFRNGEHCVAHEYPLSDADINGAVVELTGRYPTQGYVVNDVCKELALVLEGGGRLHTSDDRTVELESGDLVLLLPGEEYCFEGRMTLFVPSSPAWYPEQHRTVAVPRGGRAT